VSFGSRFFFLDQTSKVINDENAFYHVLFSIALKSVIIFMIAQRTNVKLFVEMPKF